ncbi:MAG: hypothetical protein AAGF23_14995, partial [Acidobacteriota bacterium]
MEAPQLFRRASALLVALLLVSLLAPFPVLAQAPPPDATVELVAASSERSAKVASRVMADGFLVEMLILPGTQYLGRRPLAELPPAVR